MHATRRSRDGRVGRTTRRADDGTDGRREGEIRIDIGRTTTTTGRTTRRTDRGRLRRRRDGHDGTDGRYLLAYVQVTGWLASPPDGRKIRRFSRSWDRFPGMLDGLHEFRKVPQKFGQATWSLTQFAGI